MPSCFKKSKSPDAIGQTAVVLSTEQQVMCGNCHTLQSVSKDASVFVCLSCHTVNRINPVTAEPSLEVCTPAAGDLTLRRINSSTYMPVDQTTQTESGGSGGQTSISNCAVCMDGAGDMIFLNCHHGGFCEPCARHIAQNMAVGGSHCPRCREPIVALARIVKIENNIVTAVNVEVQTSDVIKAPPKVPPPRGFNKVKKQ